METTPLLFWTCLTAWLQVTWCQVPGPETDMFDFSKIDEPMSDDIQTDGRNQRVAKCLSNRHVCSTLTKYPGGRVVSDGIQCACVGCSENWVENDNQSLTWRHYERGDKKVQYRFCIKVIPEKVCTGEELAVVMETETSHWRVYMEMARCKCPDDIYELTSWWRRHSLWSYEYHCEKKKCAINNDLCAKIYLDDVHGEILGYEFLCSCSPNHMCPSTREPEMPIQLDHRGRYVPMYCKSLKRK